MHFYLRTTLSTGAVLAALATPASADMTAARAFLDQHIGDMSVLTRDEQEAELQWFIDAAQPLRGLSINAVSETIPTHEFEARVLAPAFTAITGITVRHDLIGEADVVERLQTQLQTGENVYDLYINDADLIGTHWRYQQTRSLSEFMEGDGAAFTNPGLDLDDFIGIAMGKGPDGDLYQLPMQQFANLYWFRHDWFSDPEIQAAFHAEYGYDLGVPVNWSAYEDIAEFFTGREIDGQTAYGHMDYGRRDPSLGWRFTDAWLSMAGASDLGLPNGVPVDEWGIRVDEDYRPVGSCVARGGATNSPAAVYSIDRFVHWLNNFAPPASVGMNFSEAGPLPGQGSIAQQIFWYTVFTADLLDPSLPVMNEDGTPKWRMAPSPHGAYWQEGMKVGYQDAGSATILKSTPLDRAQAAWLYAQFIASKTVDVAKSHYGLTFIRDTTLQHESFTERAPRLGGLVEFYRSPERDLWTDTGFNVPDYPRLTQLWWQNIGDASSGSRTPQQAMDALCEQQETMMSRLERSGVQGETGPRLNDPVDPAYWLDQPGAPWPALENEKPAPITIAYEDLIRRWTE